jgi:hypothetical protein
MGLPTMRSALVTAAVLLLALSMPAVGQFFPPQCAITPNSTTGHVAVPAGTTSITTHSYYNCYSLVSISFPDSLTSIGEFAFSGCTGLVEVEIPDSVTSIGALAFSLCTSLLTVVIPRQADIGNFAFSSCFGYGLKLAPGNNTPTGQVLCLPCSGKATVSIPDSVIQVGTTIVPHMHHSTYPITARTHKRRRTHMRRQRPIHVDRVLHVPELQLADGREDPVVGDTHRLLRLCQLHCSRAHHHPKQCHLDRQLCIPGVRVPRGIGYSGLGPCCRCVPMRRLRCTTNHQNPKLCHVDRFERLQQLHLLGGGDAPRRSDTGWCIASPFYPTLHRSTCTQLDVHA